MFRAYLQASGQEASTPASKDLAAQKRKRSSSASPGGNDGSKLRKKKGGKPKSKKASVHKTKENKKADKKKHVKNKSGKKGDKKGKKRSSSSSSSSRSSSNSRSGSSVGLAAAKLLVEDQPKAAPKNQYFLSNDELQKQEIAAGARALQAQRVAARARRAADLRRESEEAWEREMQSDPPPLHQAAKRLMAALPLQQFPATEEADGKVKRLPLRLLLRQTEVAWLWIGEARELIGGGTNLPEDTL